MNNPDYWKDRAKLLEEKLNSYGVDAYREIEQSFEKAQIEIQSDIEKWYNRIAQNNNLSMNKARELLNKNELKEFRWTVEEYIKYGQDNEVSQQWMKELENASAKWHISRLEALKISTQQSMEKAFGNYLDSVDSMMKKVYTEGYYRTCYNTAQGFGVGFEVGTINEKVLDKIISKPWANDGKNFSDRIWTNKTQMINNLHNALTNTCIQGLAPDRAIKELTNFVSPAMKNARYCASRLVMTEQAFVSSASQEQVFNDLDVEEFEIVATLDNDTSQICRDMDGQHFPMTEFKVGLTAPPFHPNCRSCTCPYYNDEFTINDTRVARDENGNEVKVPANMTYREWKKTFVKHKAPTVPNANTGEKDDSQQLTKEVDSGIIETSGVKGALIESILNKNSSYLNSTQQQEFIEILNSKDEKALRFYDNLANNFANNDYCQKDVAWYKPNLKKVEMDINDYPEEVFLGNGRTAAWQTKFHEEFHQLDHLLAGTTFSRKNKPTKAEIKKIEKLGLDPNFKPRDYVEFTDIKTEYGSKMIEAIETDIKNFVNLAINFANNLNDDNTAKINDIKEIKTKKLEAIVLDFLEYNYQTDKETTQIGIFTDAIGLATRNKIDIQKKDFWGHDADYNKERGKSGATSETWATFGALYFTASQQTLAEVTSVMPNTWKLFSSVLEEVIDYSQSNELEYVDQYTFQVRGDEARYE